MKRVGAIIAGFLLTFLACMCLFSFFLFISLRVDPLSSATSSLKPYGSLLLALRSALPFALAGALFGSYFSLNRHFTKKPRAYALLFIICLSGFSGIFGLDRAFRSLENTMTEPKDIATVQTIAPSAFFKVNGLWIVPEAGSGSRPESALIADRTALPRLMWKPKASVQGDAILVEGRAYGPFAMRPLVDIEGMKKDVGFLSQAYARFMTGMATISSGSIVDLIAWTVGLALFACGAWCFSRLLAWPLLSATLCLSAFIAAPLAIGQLERLLAFLKPQGSAITIAGLPLLPLLTGIFGLVFLLVDAFLPKLPGNDAA